MSFVKRECIIPTLYCGSDKTLPTSRDKNYIRHGSSADCIKIGIGAGIHIEREKSLPQDSLQRIKYVGEVHETNFKKKRIVNTDRLIEVCKDMEKDEIEKLLKSVLKKKGGGLDKRAYNSTLLYLYSNGNSELPQCQKIET